MTIEDEIRNHKSFTPSRLRSLYNDFSNLKLLNPEGYDANIYAWSSLLQALAKKSYFGQFSFSVHEPALEDLLSLPEFGRPRSLGSVLQEMLDAETIVPGSQFVSHQSKFSLQKDAGYSISPQALLSWIMKSTGFGQFKSVDSKGKLVSERYIIWNQLVESGSNILKHLQEKMDNGVYSDCLYTGHLLRQYISDYLEKDIKPAELEILLVYWSRDQRVCSFQRAADLDEAIVKFKLEQITSDDIAIANLRDNASKVAKREMYLHEKIESTKGSIKALLQQQVKTNEGTTRQRIKSLLSTKKLLTKSFTNASELSIQLSTILSKIDDTSNNIATYQLLSQSSQVLTSMQSNIDIDQVLDLKEDIQDQIKTTDDITDALSAPQNASDDEIEQELREMEQEAQQNNLQEKEKDVGESEKETQQKESKEEPAAESAKPDPEPSPKENDVTSKMEHLQLSDNEAPQKEEPMLA